MYRHLLFLILFPAAYAIAATGSPPDKSVILFVCEHGSAKSVVAASHFNRLAKQEGLPFIGIARGTNPEPELASAAVKGLKSDGVPPGLDKPMKLTSADAQSALRIITFCDLPKDIKADHVERWTVPAVSEDYSRARDAILENLRHLIDELKQYSK